MDPAEVHPETAKLSSVSRSVYIVLFCLLVVGFCHVLVMFAL